MFDERRLVSLVRRSRDLEHELADTLRKIDLLISDVEGTFHPLSLPELRAASPRHQDPVPQPQNGDFPPRP